MKVLYLIPQAKRPDRIGAYTFLDEEIQALSAAGVDAFVLSRKAPADRLCGAVRIKSARQAFKTKIHAARFIAGRAADVPFRNLLHPGTVYHAGWLEQVASRIVLDEKIDLIHSHFAWPEGFGGILARAETGRPLVASLRGTDVLLDPALDYGRRMDSDYDRAIHMMMRIADRTICFSQFMRNHVVSLGVDPDRARVVRKGVDLSQFQPAEDRQALKAGLGLDRRPLILSVGGLIPRKGVHITLEALALVRRTHDFQFVVCGEGPELDRLQQLARTLDVHDATTFVGTVDRQTVARYFAACDVLAHAPIVEAAGNVLFEAMASGRPVVCSRAGGPEEYVEDGRSGYVVPAQDPGALAESIAALLADPALADRLGREGLRQSRTAFSFDRMTRDILAVYEEAVSLRDRHLRS